MNLNEFVINRGRGRGKRCGRSRNYSGIVTDMGPPLNPPPKKRNNNYTPSSDQIWGKSHISVPNTTSTHKSASTSKISSDEESRVIVALTEGRGEARCEVGIAAVDVSKPLLVLCQISDTQSYINTLTKINIFNPHEILVPLTFVENFSTNRLIDKVKEHFPRIKYTACVRSTFNKANGMDILSKLCIPSLNAILLMLEHRYYALAAVSALVTYIQDNLFIYYAAGSIKVDYQESEGYAIIDVSTADRLELVCSAKPAQANKYSSLFGVLNHCQTKIGARTLRSSILQPPCKVEYIEERLDAVVELIRHPEILLSVQALLQKLSNVDLLLSIATLIPDDPQRCSNRQLNYVLLLNELVEVVPPLKDVLAKSKHPLLARLTETLSSPEFGIIKEIVRETIHENARQAKGQAAIMQRCFAIKPGINGLLDLVRKTYSERLNDMTEYVRGLAEKYDLPLTLGNNQTKGYHIVLALNQNQKRHMKKSDLPNEFIEVYRLAGSFTMKTPEMVNLTTRLDDIMSDILKISNVTVHSILVEIKKYVPLFYQLCEGIALLDVLQSLAECSVGNGYVRPHFGSFTEVSFAHHPLLDFLLTTKPVPNPISCSQDYNVHIITGPNGSGKSIFIRQVMLLQIMAQVGCFVPAQNATFRPADRMYARIYLEDNMEHGASSFILEMKEIKYIMTTMTSNSLVIIDELCRSTCLEEGTALAIAIVEKLAQSLGFVYITTHFTLLAKLWEMYPNVKLWQLETIPSGDDPKTFKLDFRHALKPGVTSVRRYGVYIVRNLWPDSTLKYVDDLLDKISKKPKDPKIVSLDSKVRLKYELESQFRKLKSQGQLTVAEINTLVNKYQNDLEKLGYRLEVMPIGYNEGITSELPSMNHFIFGDIRNENYSLTSSQMSSELEMRRQESMVRRIFTPELSQEQKYFDHSCPNMSFYNNLQQVNDYKGNVSIDSQRVNQDDSYGNISQFLAQDSENVHKLIPEVNISYGDVCDASENSFYDDRLSDNFQRVDDMSKSIRSDSPRVHYIDGSINSRQQFQSSSDGFPFHARLQDSQRPNRIVNISKQSSSLHDISSSSLQNSQKLEEFTPSAHSKQSRFRFSGSFQKNQRAQDINNSTSSKQQFQSNNFHFLSQNSQITEKIADNIPSNESSFDDISYSPLQNSQRVDIINSGHSKQQLGYNLNDYHFDLRFQNHQRPERSTSSVHSSQSSSFDDIKFSPLQNSQRAGEITNFAYTKQSNFNLSVPLQNKRRVEDVNNNTYSQQSTSKLDGFNFAAHLQNNQRPESRTSSVRSKGTSSSNSLALLPLPKCRQLEGITSDTYSKISDFTFAIAPQSIERAEKTTERTPSKQHFQSTLDDFGFVVPFQNNQKVVINSTTPSKPTFQSRLDDFGFIVPPQDNQGLEATAEDSAHSKQSSSLDDFRFSAPLQSNLVKTSTPTVHQIVPSMPHFYTGMNFSSSTNDTPIRQRIQSKNFDLESIREELEVCSRIFSEEGDDFEETCYKSLPGSPREKIEEDPPKEKHEHVMAVVTVIEGPNDKTLSFDEDDFKDLPDYQSDEEQTENNVQPLNKKINIISDVVVVPGKAEEMEMEEESVYEEEGHQEKSFELETVTKTKDDEDYVENSSPSTVKSSLMDNACYTGEIKSYKSFDSTYEAACTISDTELPPGRLNDSFKSLANTEDDNSFRSCQYEEKSYQEPPTHEKSNCVSSGYEISIMDDLKRLFTTSVEKTLNAENEVEERKEVDSPQKEEHFTSTQIADKTEVTGVSLASKLRKLDEDEDSTSQDDSGSAKKTPCEKTITSISSASRKRNLDQPMSDSTSTMEKISEGEDSSLKESDGNKTGSKPKKRKFLGPRSKVSLRKSPSTDSGAKKKLAKKPALKNKFVPPKRLSVKEIQQEFEEQDKKILENSSNSSNLSKYLENLVKRPTIKQIQNSTHLATVRKTDHGVEVIPSKPPKKKIKRNASWKKHASVENVDVTIFSDKNALAFGNYLNSTEKDYKTFFSFNFNKSQQEEEQRMKFAPTTFSFGEYTNKSITERFVRTPSDMSCGRVDRDGAEIGRNVESREVVERTMMPEGFFEQNKEDITRIMNKYLQTGNAPRNIFEDEIDTSILNI